MTLSKSIFCQVIVKWMITYDKDWKEKTRLIIIVLPTN